MGKIMIVLKSFSSCCALVLLLSALATAQYKADITYLNSKGSQKTDLDAKISQWTYKSLEFKGRRTKRNIDVDAIVAVKFTKSPAIFEDAMEMMADGAYRSALPSFLDILEGKDLEGGKLRKRDLWCQEHALYNAWVISRAIGQLGEANKYRDTLRKSYPKSHYIPEIILREANDLYAYGDFAKAQIAYSKLADEAAKKGFSNQYKVMAGIGGVRSLMGQKKFVEAASAQANVSARALNENSRLRCEIVRGEVLVAQKKIGAAESLFRNLLSKADYKTQAFLFAGAANGLGDCLYSSGKYKEASFEYSKTFALFLGVDGLDHELGWAFWRFANSCKQISAKTEGETAKVFDYRFRKNRDRVAGEYRLSRGGQLARREKGMSK